MLGNFIKMNTASTSGTLPSNIVTNPKEDLKGITTRSGVAYKGPTIHTTSSPKVVEREPEEVDINKKTENQAKMTKLSMEWKRLCKIKAKDKKKVKVRVNTEESAVKPEPELKNTIASPN
ncbi:hypothetical protein Tco_0532587 [Tanacetum coccineum]